MHKCFWWKTITLRVFYSCLPYLWGLRLTAESDLFFSEYIVCCMSVVWLLTWSMNFRSLHGRDLKLYLTELTSVKGSVLQYDELCTINHAYLSSFASWRPLSLLAIHSWPWSTAIIAQLGGRERPCMQSWNGCCLPCYTNDEWSQNNTDKNTIDQIIPSQFSSSCSFWPCFLSFLFAIIQFFRRRKVLLTRFWTSFKRDFVYCDRNRRGIFLPTPHLDEIRTNMLQYINDLDLISVLADIWIFCRYYNKSKHQERDIAFWFHVKTVRRWKI